MTTVSWQAKLRNYGNEKIVDLKPATSGHPLISGVMKQKPSQNISTSKLSKKAGKAEEILDPLSRMAQENQQLGGPAAVAVDFDPLTSMNQNFFGMRQSASNPLEPAATKARSSSNASTVEQMAVPGSKRQAVVTAADDLWSTKRTSVLNTYTTKEKLAIRTSVLPKDNIHEVVIQAEKLRPTDRVEQRLAELNDFDEATKTECVSVSVEEYLQKISDVNTMLTAAWRDEQRVKAVRLAIQCAKMLNDTSVIEFYPSKFVLITDILDNFGNLVFDRLRTKAESVVQYLRDDFTTADVPNAAKETTFNWFYKLASIRELLPRIYMQAAILQSLRFISDKPLDEWLEELMMMARGVSNPIVSLYTSAYLCRVGLRAYYLQKTFGTNVTSSGKQMNGSSSSAGDTFSSAGKCLPRYLRNCIDDFLLISRQQSRLNFDRIPKDDNIALGSYVRLFVPALEWIFQCVCCFASNSNSSSLLATDILRTADCHPNYDLIIHCLLSSFPPSFVIEMAGPIASALADMKHSDLPKQQLFRALCLALLNAEPLFADRRKVLELAWPHIGFSSDLPVRDILLSTEVWLEYTGKFLQLSDSDAVLGIIVETCSKTKEPVDSYSAVLQSTLSKFVQYVTDFPALLVLPNFMKMIDCFGKGSVKAEACRVIVDAFRKEASLSVVSDQVFIDSFMFLCKTWHDSSINYQSSVDISRQMSKSVNAFINKVDYGRDFEKLLQFYMDCRSTFVYLEDVVVSLIMMVNRAVMNVLHIVGGVHSKRTLNFAKASVAFCYITIPSIGDPFKQLRLEILTAQTALVNGCIGQAEALFKMAITTLTEVPTCTLGTDGRQHPTDVAFADTIAQLAAALLPLPDSPEQAALYVWRGLLNAVQRYDWQAAAAMPSSSYSATGQKPVPKIDALVSILLALTALAQPKYIYSVNNIDANDVLYGGDSRFVARIDELAGEVLAAIMTDLEERFAGISPSKKPSGQIIVAHQALVARVASSLLPILNLENVDCLRIANRFWELSGPGNQRLVKLKSLIFPQKTNATAQLFCNT